jgi:hypothetical protein
MKANSEKEKRQDMGVWSTLMVLTSKDIFWKDCLKAMANSLNIARLNMKGLGTKALVNQVWLPVTWRKAAGETIF